MGTTFSTPFGAGTPTRRKHQVAGNNKSPGKRKRAPSDDHWDFEHVPLDEHALNPSFASVASTAGPLAWPVPQTHPPVYILEASMSEQELWHCTAGQRPVQPPDERKYFESLYINNFKKSEALKDKNIFDEPAIEKACQLRRETSEEVLFRGKGPFSYAVSKSFLHCTPPSMTLQIPRFEIRGNNAGWRHAEFLIVVSINTLTFGIWRRYSEFKNLFQQVRQLNKSETHYNEYNNSVLSWECLKNRQRMYRCLDKDYVALKCFLLERFLHDLLFESPTPALLVDFLGLT